ncbi:hypothetical protein V6N13_125895 [Hibiscus sabdariffa]|uniref:Uncharacterized protein n=1 Tax=Hibiscus sabdariffa TaxID=183260 RepID=A0ABR2NX33_9ROSI
MKIKKKDEGLFKIEGQKGTLRLMSKSLKLLHFPSGQGKEEQWKHIGISKGNETRYSTGVERHCLGLARRAAVATTTAYRASRVTKKHRLL